MEAGSDAGSGGEMKHRLPTLAYNIMVIILAVLAALATLWVAYAVDLFLFR